MKQLQKDLQSMVKTLTSLAKKIDAISKKLGGVKKTKPVAKSPAKLPKKAAAAKTVKKRTPKKAAVPTASETIHKIISRSQKGVNVAVLTKKTGFNTKKIQNAVFKLKKQGKIKSPAKGVYVKA